METKKVSKKMNKKFRVVSFGQLAEEVKSLPKKEVIWGGIKEGTLGTVIGPAKSGKTTCCENLALSLAVGEKQFLGKKLYDGKPHKILFINFEENCLPRYERIKNQMALFGQAGLNKLVEDNFIMPDCEFQQSVSTDSDWSFLTATIENSGAKIVFLDSLTRLYKGSIEESIIAQKLTIKLRALHKKLGLTIIIIHHTTKNGGKPMSMDSMAGSRIISQETDYAIGINKSPTGRRYLKEIYSRYAEQVDIVQEFYISKNQWLVPVQEVNEMELFRMEDGRESNETYEKLKKYFQDNGPDKSIKTHCLISAFVNTKLMSKPTLHSQINALVSSKVIQKVEKGEYRLCSSRKEVDNEK